MLRRRLIAMLVLAAGLVMPGGASAASYGMSDGRDALFDSADIAALNFQQVRLVLPWNAASRAGSWSTWLRRAQLQGYPILVALGVDDGHDCTGGDCTGPTPAAYRSALAALLEQYPGIDSVEAWNEPNHSMQPTAKNPALAAHYFDAAAAACAGRCTAVAGNMLDVPSMGTYLSAYRAALTVTPAVWGVHDYYDATYFGRSGLDQILAVAGGPVWITEVGGLVTFKSYGGTLSYDEHRAADSLRWMFSLALTEPRIARMYLYGMWQQPSNPFDSALLRVDNTERESMSVARAYVGPRAVRLPGAEAPLLPATVIAAGDDTSQNRALAAAAAAAANSSGTERRAAGTLVIVGKRVRVDAHRRAALTVRCVGPGACSGRLEVHAGTWRYRHSVVLAASKQRTLRLHLSRAGARSLVAHRSSKAWTAACSGGASCSAAPRTPVVAAAR